MLSCGECFLQISIHFKQVLHCEREAWYDSAILPISMMNELEDISIDLYSSDEEILVVVTEWVINEAVLENDSSNDF